MLYFSHDNCSQRLQLLAVTALLEMIATSTALLVRQLEDLPMESKQ